MALSTTTGEGPAIDLGNTHHATVYMAIGMAIGMAGLPTFNYEHTSEAVVGITLRAGLD
ncbi:hypothetical protein LTR46_002391 [Exophiala xenobiotica]|nr:hypothetical protein LTR46_002391 [Exophiala xenobiotica]